MKSRLVRVFISSTFRDFIQERDLLVRKVFPELRRKCRERQVELVDVDLRWGITEKEAQQGKVLPICLAEIDRSRPYFMGFIGERYGWVPEKHQYDLSLILEQPWLDEHRGGKSVTELEMLHGVLNNSKMAGRAFFYFRSPAYSRKKGGSYLSEGTEEKAKLGALKDRIRKSRFPVVENYRSPEKLAEKVREDLWKLIDESFPESEVPDALARERMRHEAYSATRRGLYLGGERYFKALDAAMKAKPFRPVLISGQSGAGKSALLANWVTEWIKRHPKSVVIVHHLGCSADAADPVQMASRLMEEMCRIIGEPFESEPEPNKLLEKLPEFLSRASIWAKRQRKEFLFVLDGLDKVSDRRHLGWFPSYFPPRIKLVASCLDGEILEGAKSRFAWLEVRIKPFTKAEQKHFIRNYLGRYRKSLTADQTRALQSHSLSGNPLFLLTVLEELRVFGVHEKLSDRLLVLLSPPPSKAKNEVPTVDDVFEHVLSRIEQDVDRKPAQAAMESIWASRNGLFQDEILKIAHLAPKRWATIQVALDEALYESGGKINFGHDFLRKAVADRYLPTKRKQRAAHSKLARYFSKQAPGQRVAEELPHQCRMSERWAQLQHVLTRVEYFECISEHLSEEEHLGYWLSLEQKRGRQLLEPLLYSAWRRWSLSPHKERTGDLADRLGLFLCSAGRGLNGNFRVTLALLALNVEKRIYGARHKNAAVRLNHLALSLQDIGDYAAAEPLFRQALAITEKALGPDHPTTAGRLNNLALLLKDIGDYAAAEPLFRRALAITERALGPDHPTTAIRLNNLALALSASGDLESAEHLNRRALAITERALGPDHPTTAIRLNNLAHLLNEAGNLNDAESLCLRSLSIRERTLGPEHPDTAASLAGLALLLKERGDLHRAEPLCRRALAIREKALGPEHPQTATTINNLAMLLDAKGSHKAAKRLFMRSLRTREKMLGSEHPDTGTAYSNFAFFLHDKGDHSGAEPLFRRAVAISEKTKGLYHAETGLLLWFFADSLSELGNDDEAVRVLLRELSVSKKLHGNETDDTARTHQRLGVLMRNLRNYSEAEKHLSEALRVFELVAGRQSDEVAGVLNGLGKLENERRNFPAAVRLFDESLKIRRKVAPGNKAAIKSLEESAAAVRKAMKEKARRK